ncbi:MAG: CHAT domain-containing protein [bacterium]
MRTLSRIKIYFFGNWKRGVLLTGIILTSIIVLVSFCTQTPEFAQIETSFVSPDSLKAYRLSSQDQKMLAEWLEFQSKGKPDSVHKWVRNRYLPLQIIGLKLLEQATLYRKQGDLQIAEAKLHISRELGEVLAEVVGDTFLLQQVWFNEKLDHKRMQKRALASVVYANAYEQIYAGNYDDVQKQYEFVIDLANEISDNKLQIDAMVGLQYIYNYKNQHQSVIDLGNQIVEKAEKIGCKRRLSIALLQIAEAYLYLDQDNNALETIEKTISIAKLMNDLELLARNYFSKAQLLYRMENYQESESLLEKLTEIDLEGIYNGLVKLIKGQIYVKRGEYGRAQPLFEEAIRFFRSRNDKLNEAVTLSNLSLLYNGMGEFDSALNIEKKSLEIKKLEKNIDRVALSLSNIGLFYFKMDSLEKAMGMFQQALHLFQSGGIRHKTDILLGLGQVQLKIGNLTAASESFTTAEKLAISLNYQHGKVEALLGKGQIALNQKQTEKAWDYFSSALKTARVVKVPRLYTEAYYGLAQVEILSSNFNKAAQTLEKAIKSSEMLRQSIYQDNLQVSYFATTQDLFDEAILLSLTLDRKDLAVHYAEQARARALLDALGKTTVAELESDRVEMLESPVPPFEELIGCIPEFIQVIEYRLTPDTLLVWLLDRNKVVYRLIPCSSKTLEVRVKQFLNSLGALNLETFQIRVQQDIESVYHENRQLGRELYQLLVEPIAEEITPGKQLYIIPDGYLHRLPFGALVTNDNRFFDELYVWTKSPSLAILFKGLNWQKRVVHPQNSRFLMVAGNMPSTKTQKRIVQRFFNNSKVLEKKDANYSVLKEYLNDGVEILYLSVHAVADERHPMNSYIELYADNASNGELPRTKVYARQLLELDLSNTWLAVLNACETATGRIARGEGVLNMVRIFTLGRVPVVIASLWKNDDRRSAEIIGQFCEGLVQGLGVSKALHLAKNHCIQQLKHDDHYPLPYFWAVFEVYENSWQKQHYLESI